MRVVSWLYVQYKLRITQLELLTMIVGPGTVPLNAMQVL